jgi:hypothetical protein
MPKPSSLPAWNTGGANRTEPSAGIKTTGHATNDKPVSSYENWWKNLVYEWCSYLDTFLTTANTWTALQTFTAKIAISGSYAGGHTNTLTAGNIPKAWVSAYSNPAGIGSYGGVPGFNVTSVQTMAGGVIRVTLTTGLENTAGACCPSIITDHAYIWSFNVVSATVIDFTAITHAGAAVDFSVTTPPSQVAINVMGRQ